MLSCPRCHQTNPANSAFCNQCGAGLVAAPVNPIPVPQPANHIKGVVFAAVGIALLAALYAGYSQLFLKKTDVQNTNILAQTSRPNTPDLLRQDPPEDTDLTQITPPPPGAKMPADIEAWLRHLQKIEQRRQRLTMRQLGEMTAAMASFQLSGIESLIEEVTTDPMGETEGNTQPADRAKSTLEDVRAEWRTLIQDFGSVAPPEECIPIRQQFDTALGETSGMISDLTEVLEQAANGGNPQELVGQLSLMKGSSKNIDKAGEQTDALVQEICDKYETRKWFDIASDIGTGGLLGIGG